MVRETISLPSQERSKMVMKKTYEVTGLMILNILATGMLLGIILMVGILQ